MGRTLLNVLQRFTGPQILRFRSKHPDAYAKTSRISLVSSFLASIFLGQVAPIDISDACGMNLWDIQAGKYHEGLLALTAGDDPTKISDLKFKLGNVPESGSDAFGKVSSYFVRRYGFNPESDIIPFTGDNPSTILALPLRPLDAMVSLGTSTTFLMSTPYYKPDPSVHFMNHPTTPGIYMFMLCYKNGESFGSLGGRPCRFCVTGCPLLTSSPPRPNTVSPLHPLIKENLSDKSSFPRRPCARTSARFTPSSARLLQRPLVPIQPSRHHAPAPQRRLAFRAPEIGAVLPAPRDRA